ncbi:hypothetical protein [uncultured Flavobacterium sp.]|uniref:hypothetical protein n=1 Tax=uncultured Flavobacterium sp. TaxID=165435 RepID=UPI0025F5F803|nr:hypothetical protein [uncultured Flavobacterium sp.]
MKKIISILLLFIGTLSYSQDTLMKPMAPKMPDTPMEHVSIYAILPGAVGNNVLARANKGKSGFGIAVTFFEHKKLHIMGLYEFMHYEVTDPSLAANVEYTNLANYGLQVLYKIPVAERLAVNPKFSASYMTLNQRANGTSYGKQEGFGLSAGFDTDFKIARGLRIFAGLGYAWSFPKTNTNEEFKSFFGKLQQLNIQFGIKL